MSASIALTPGFLYYKEQCLLNGFHNNMTPGGQLHMIHHGWNTATNNVKAYYEELGSEKQREEKRKEKEKIDSSHANIVSTISEIKEMEAKSKTEGYVVGAVGCDGFRGENMYYAVPNPIVNAGAHLQGYYGNMGIQATAIPTVGIITAPQSPIKSASPGINTVGQSLMSAPTSSQEVVDTSKTAVKNDDNKKDKDDDTSEATPEEVERCNTLIIKINTFDTSSFEKEVSEVIRNLIKLSKISISFKKRDLNILEKVYAIFLHCQQVYGEEMVVKDKKSWIKLLEDFKIPHKDRLMDHIVQDGRNPIECRTKVLIQKYSKKIVVGWWDEYVGQPIDF